MQRGILTLTKTELFELSEAFPLSQYSQYPLVNKLIAGLQSETPEVSLEVSEDELEILLDEMGIPNPQMDSENMKLARRKINQLLKDFRKPLLV